MLTLYVHIPFCRQRCSYCDFYLVTRRDNTGAFFRALALETEARAEELKGRTISAIHFGGGTPSMVEPHYIAEWLEQVSGLCSFTEDIEIALEANPEDLRGSALQELRSAGITRLSIGTQSFTSEKLRALGRAHTAIDCREVSVAALNFFRSVSVDLICGVPGETLSLWEEDLERALELRPHHLSVYMLSVEPKTQLSRMVQSGALAVPDDGVQANLYLRALEAAESCGYSHYEVSNFALPGHHSRYNLASWERKPYLGFGPSAHSFLVQPDREIRTANVSSLSRYLARPGSAEGFREELSPQERFTEEVFLSLRINRGLDVEFLRKGNKLGHRLSEVIARFSERGWILEDGGALFLTGKGFLFADLIAGELIFG
ncbi:MAG: radical SAM family heme chaperone HemW [Chlorobiaceae bacterium]